RVQVMSQRQRSLTTKERHERNDGVFLHLTRPHLVNHKLLRTDLHSLRTGLSSAVIRIVVRRRLGNKAQLRQRTFDRQISRRVRHLERVNQWRNTTETTGSFPQVVHILSTNQLLTEAGLSSVHRTNSVLVSLSQLVLSSGSKLTVTSVESRQRNTRESVIKSTPVHLANLVHGNVARGGNSLERPGQLLRRTLMHSTPTLRSTAKRGLEVIQPLNVSRRKTPAGVLSTDQFALVLILSESNLANNLRVGKNTL